ncbi:hypothetical protein OAW23_10110 [Flavobacteriales bacterium]|nr:hypothetical protein [Flavobacteriales bacterium]
MGWINKIQIAVGNYELKKEVARKRDVTSCNWNSASSIGILYKIDDERSLKHIKWYMKEIKKRYGQKRIFALGYLDEKSPAPYLSHGLDQDYIFKKNLNWYGKPTSKVAGKFIGDKFDLLIDLTEGNCVPLRFALLRSRAKFKVGKHTKENELACDLLIGVQEDGWNHYMEQLDKYIGMINISKSIS